MKPPITTPSCAGAAPVAFAAEAGVRRIALSTGSKAFNESSGTTLRTAITGALKKAAKITALQAPLGSIRRKLIPCTDLPHPIKRGGVYHAYCVCGHHNSRREFPSHTRREDALAPIFIAGGDPFHDRQGSDKNGRLSWPLDDDGRLDPELWPRESEEPVHIGEFEGAEAVDPLGSYQDMASPGVISLYMSNTLCEFWRHIEYMRQQFGLRLSPTSLLNLASLQISATYHHEQFHHFCDVQTHLTGQTDRRWRTRHMEEPLAVAYSRFVIGSNFKATNEVLEFLKKRYDYGNLRFYSDWNRYFAEPDLRRGISDYLPLPSAQHLRGLGFPVNDLLLRSVHYITAYEYYGVVFWWPPRCA